MRLGRLLALVPLLVAADTARPPPGVELAGRTVFPDPAMPLPEKGEAFYAFTDRAIDRAFVKRQRERGFRYLGALAVHTYVFLREGDRAFDTSGVAGTAVARPIDRLEIALARADARAALAHPLAVTLWPHATAGEARALAPEAASRARLPAAGDAPVLEERFLYLDRAESDLARLARSPIVAAIAIHAPPKSHNATSRALAHAPDVERAPFNLDGTGVLVGHWDGGRVDSAHPDFQGRVTNKETGSVSTHATHTAGTILGAGLRDAGARGFAPKANLISYTFYGDANAERRAAKHTYYHEHDNHSWGADDGERGTYSTRAREFDQDARDVFLLAVKSAGNEGSRSQMVDEGYGFDSLASDSTVKNVLIIGATKADGQLASFSSRGPTDDGRIKPDISADGSGLRSTTPNNSYGSMSGTSMSAPSVSGMLALLAQLHERGSGGLRWAPDETRAVMIHSATDVFHKGPDYRHGWGNADVLAAASLMAADQAAPGKRLARGALREGETVELPMEVPAGAPELKVTLSWLDAYANGTAQRRLLNDLDLELVSPSGEVRLPWTLDPANPFADAVQTRKNDRDNVEQVLVDAPAAGRWIVRVKGTAITDPDLPVQGFVLATSHALERSLLRAAAEVPATGLAIPDGDPAGVTLSLPIADGRNVRALRLALELSHEERGQLRVVLEDPSGARATIEGEDTSVRRDLYAIYPDLRSYDEDVTALRGKPAMGTWRLSVIDTRAGVSGRVISAMLELDLEGEPAAPPPPANQPPTASAGKDAAVDPGTAVELDGTRSSDPDGDEITFAWEQLAGEPVQLSSATTARPTFTAPAQGGALFFRLTVTDTRGATGMDDVTITVRDATGAQPNRDPTARVAFESAALPGATVTVDASASSDPDSDPLTFRWMQTSGPEVTLEGADTDTVRFTAPAVTEAAIVSLQVEVDDGRGGVDLASARIALTPPGTDPPRLDEGLRGTVGGACGCTAAHPRRGAQGGLLLLVLAALVLRQRRFGGTIIRTKPATTAARRNGPSNSGTTIG